MAVKKKTDTATVETPAEKPKRKNIRNGTKKKADTASEKEIDLDSFDWGEDCKLTEKQKLFVIWFTYPDKKTYHNAMQAALKAGYTKNTATVESARMRRIPQIATLIKKFDDVYTRESVDDFFHNALQTKITRASFDIKDFYERRTYTDKDGNEHEYIGIKDPSKLTPEQRKCIDGIRINNNGSPSYEFADRTHETEFLMKLKREIDSGGDNSNGFETELTIEQIKDKVTAKLKVIQKKDEEEQLAGKYIDEPDNLIEEA